MNKDKVYLEGYVVGHAADTLGYKGLLVQLGNADIEEIDKDLVNEIINEPQPIKLKDVIARIGEFNLATKAVWINGILNELGSDYGTLKYKDGYDQGKLEGEWVGQQLKNADKIRQEINKPTIPQFVADWIEYCKFTHVDLQHALIVGDVYFYNYANQKDFSKLKEFLETENNQETFARAWLDGYTVEKEKRYTVKMKNVLVGSASLIRGYNNEWYYSHYYSSRNGVHHTHKELEQAGFGWVFDCPGIEIEEVEG